MAKGKFKLKNTANFTEEQVIGQPVDFIHKNNRISLGTITSADEDYLYIEFEHNGDNDLILESSSNITWSMEVKDE